MPSRTGLIIEIGSQAAKAGAAKVNRALDTIKNKSKLVVDKVRKGFGGLKGAIAAAGIGLLFRELIQVNKQFETMRGALVTITGSTNAANQEFNALQEFAKTTPFTLDQSINAFIKLQNLGIRPTEERLKSFGNTSAAMGKSLNQFVEAVADASTMEFERLKEFGIKARQQTDTVLFTFQGLTTTVGKNSQEIIQYLENIGKVNFAGAMEQQMSRLPGILSNLEDSFSRLAGAIGEGGFTKAVGDAATVISSMISDIVESGRAAQFGKVLGESIGFIGKTAVIVTDAITKLWVGLDEGFAQISNRIAAWLQGVDVKRVMDLYETEKLADLQKSLTELRFPKMEIGATLPEIQKSSPVPEIEKITDTTEKATKSIEKMSKPVKELTNTFQSQIPTLSTWQQAILAGSRSFENALNDLVSKGTVNIKQFTDSLISEINRVLLHALIMQPILTALGVPQYGYGYGYGNAMSGGATATASKGLPFVDLGTGGLPIPTMSGKINTSSSPMLKQSASINNNITVVTPDIGSFKQSENQIVSSLSRKMKTSLRSLAIK